MCLCRYKGFLTSWKVHVKLPFLYFKEKAKINIRFDCNIYNEFNMLFYINLISLRKLIS